MRPNEAAQALASYGRYGDTMLLHVNPLEVAGIASLVPGGLTTNPVTGLPEAFFFLPFLASMFSAAAPAAAAATAGAAAAGATAAGGALAGGLTAGAGLASTLGAGALTPALTAGTGLLASAAPAAGTIAATAAPAVTGGLGSLLGAGAATPALTAAAPAASSALAPGAIGAGLSAASPVASGGLGSLLSGGTNTLLGGGAVDPLTTAGLHIDGPIFAPGGNMPSPLATPGGQSYAMGAGPIAGPPPAPPSGATVLSGPKTGLLPPGPPTAGLAGQTVLGGANTGLPVTAAGPNAATGPGALGKLGDYFAKNPMMALAGLQALKGLIPAGGKKKEKSNYRKGKYQGGPPVAASAGFQHGIEPEHDYFPGYSNLYANNGGLVGYAEGGLVDPQAQKPQDMSFPLNGVPGGGGISDLVPEEIPSSPFPTEQIGSSPEPGADPAAVDTSNDQELVMQMVEVIQGKHPNPEPVIKAFVQEFGEQALQDLAMRVKQTTQGQPPQGGPTPPMPPMPSPGGPSPMDMVGPPPQMGPPPPSPKGFAFGGPVGDGLSDSVPAKLSVGEFVVPADAVSGLGNGSTDAGAQHLQGMVNNVRMARGGSVQQPMPIRGGIAAMMNGGLVA